MSGDASISPQLIVNLLQNAATHTGNRHEIRFALDRSVTHFHLTVADNGPASPRRHAMRSLGRSTALSLAATRQEASLALHWFGRFRNGIARGSPCWITRPVCALWLGLQR
ncbi:ATP-binding protein [Pseudorhodobacter sp.]|uniref:ATP-binding protein n=1 Tax=Pseudorhodobacter sp. TaxID=1934400 RepID=UPI003464D3D5